MVILVTGGLGFIGSHTCTELLNHNYELIVIDNLSNCKESVKEKIELIAKKKIHFIKCDLRSRFLLRNVFKYNGICAVIHFAGCKAVGESVENPLKYFNNNTLGTINLLSIMDEYRCRNLIFSSSCTVYGNPKYLPIDERHPYETLNPYGRTKHYIDTMLKDLHTSDKKWNICSLRYFNPVGKHKSGLIFEDPNGIPTNLFPYIHKVMKQEYDVLKIFGGDYNTRDGTPIRDYIHIEDLADAHVKALKFIETQKGCMEYINLGTGNGYSVLEVVKMFEIMYKINIPYKIVGRREGDAEEVYSDNTKAYNLLKWTPKLGLEQMV